MPTYSCFYSATEAEAAAGLIQLFPQKSEDAPALRNHDVKRLASLLDGTTVSRTCLRRDFDQPLFHPKPPEQSVEELLNASTFGITHETVYRDSPVHYESTSDDSQEWKTRTRTPSSDGPSLRKYDFPSPTLSVKAEVSSLSDGSEDGRAQKTKPTGQTHMKSWAARSDHYATYPQDVLQTMGTQFSKWSYDLNEGTTAVPFVMAKAPSETHVRLVAIDRKLWVTGTEDGFESVMDSEATAKALLERVQENISKQVWSNKAPKRTTDSTSREPDSAPKDGPTSKRAALIARGQAAKYSSLIAGKSLGQKCSAQQKNKNRRSIMPSPPPTARKQEPARKPEPQAEQSKPTILILNPKEENQRRDVDSALQDGQIDFGNRQTLKTLMEQLGKSKTDADNGRLAEQAQETDLNEDGAEQNGRLKGKARRKAKSISTR